MQKTYTPASLNSVFRGVLTFVAFLAVTVPFLPVAAHAQAPSVSYSAPIVITQGGVYTGNYRSLDSNVPCVRIETTDPVVLEGCTLSGAGDLVRVVVEGADVTVRECSGYGLLPSVNGQARGRFIDIPHARRLTVEHNYLEHTSGIVVYRWRGNGSPNQTLTVRYNKVSNIDGRWRNGQGSTRSSFLLLNTVQQLARVDISYNQIINEPNESLVEDNINFYNSSGTAQSSLQVHDNYVQGAYPFPANGSSFTGTGLTTDGDGTSLAVAAGNLEAHHNQFVSTCNAAMNIAAGHDIYFHDNRMVTSGLLPDGSRLNATYAATAVFNYYQVLAAIFFNNRIEQNTIGYVRWGANSPFPDRQDLSPGACATCTGNTHLPNPITRQTEQNEWTLWQQKLQTNGIAVGITSNAPANVAPTVSLGASASTLATGATLTLTATAADADGSISTVEFFAGSTKLGEATSAPYQLSYSPTSPGTVSLTARATDNAGAATTSAALSVTVTAPAPANGTNLVLNPSFDDDGQSTQTPRSWATWSAANQVNADYTESYPNSRTGTYHGTHYLGRSYEVYTYQVLSNLPNGSYTLRAWTRSGGRQNTAVLLAKNFGGSETQIAIPTTSGGESGPWQQVELQNIQVTNGQCEIGFYSDARPNQWLYFDDVEFVRQNGQPAPNVAPTVGLGASASTLATGATLTLTATAADADGSISTVEFFAGSTKLGEATSAPYQLSYSPTSPGTVSLTARATDNAGAATTSAALSVTVTAPAPANGTNLVLNPSFDDDGQSTQTPRSWATWGGSFNQDYADYTESYGGSRTGTYHGTHYSLLPYEVYTYQVLSNLPNGLYTLRAWVKSGGGQNAVVLLAKNFGGSQRETTPATTPGGTGGTWTQVTMQDIQVTNGQCEIGFYSRTSGFGQWVYFDDVEFFEQSAAGNRGAALPAAATPAGSEAAAMTIYPNPARGAFQVSTTFEQAGTADIWLVTQQGLRVAHFQQRVQAGANELTIPATALPEGTYLVQIQSGRTVRSQRVQLIP